MTIQFKACTLEDLPALQAIARATFEETFANDNDLTNMQSYLNEAFSSEKLTKELGTKGTYFFLLHYEGKRAGYLKLNVDAAQTEPMGADKLEIERIYVKQAFQGHGLGQYLMQKAIEFALNLQKYTIWLGVWEKNTKAIAFYERAGFKKIGTHTFTLGDEEQLDYMMEKTLLK